LSLQENRLLIISNNIQEDSERIYSQYILFKNAAAACACHESGFWRVHLSARLPQRAEAEHAIL